MHRQHNKIGEATRVSADLHRSLSNVVNGILLGMDHLVSYKVLPVVWQQANDAEILSVVLYVVSNIGVELAFYLEGSTLIVQTPSQIEYYRSDWHRAIVRASIAPYNPHRIPLTDKDFENKIIAAVVNFEDRLVHCKNVIGNGVSHVILSTAKDPLQPFKIK